MILKDISNTENLDKYFEGDMNYYSVLENKKSNEKSIYRCVIAGKEVSVGTALGDTMCDID